VTEPGKQTTDEAGLWQKVVDLLETASEQRHIVALRDGMIGSIPVILVGSTFLLLGVQGAWMKDVEWIANSAFYAWYTGIAGTLLIPYRFTMGILSLYVTFTIAAALAKQYKLPEIPNALTAAATFLLAGQVVAGKIYLPGQELDPELGMGGKFIPAEPLGAEGLFLAIIVGLVTVEISRVLTFTPKEDSEATANVPPAVIHAFASFLPMLTCVMIMWGIRHGIGFNIHEFIVEHTQFLKNLGDTYGAVVVVNILLHVFGVAGVHGISVINAGMLPIWMEFLVANADAHEMGKAMPYVTAYPFYQWFIWIGGAGATLAPTVRCMFSKNAHVRKIGRVAFVPGLFNINEPLLFGLPVVANPILAVPFITAPLACGTIAYFATAWDLVAKTWIEVPWVSPCFVGAFLSTQDYRAVFLLAVNLVVSYVIWAPFISAYERRLAHGAEKSQGSDSDEEVVCAEPAEPSEEAPSEASETEEPK
jgi:PTS system cellobiose-specific IIC component